MIARQTAGLVCERGARRGAAQQRRRVASAVFTAPAVAPGRAKRANCARSSARRAGWFPRLGLGYMGLFVKNLRGDPSPAGAGSEWGAARPASRLRLRCAPATPGTASL
jgi:hypothetical protein